MYSQAYSALGIPRDITVTHKISAIILYLLDPESYFLNHLLVSLSMAGSATLVKNDPPTTMGTTDLLDHVGLRPEHQDTRPPALGTDPFAFAAFPTAWSTTNLLVIFGHLDDAGLDVIQSELEFEDWLCWGGGSGWWPATKYGLKGTARAKGASPSSKQISQAPKPTEALLGGIMLCSLFNIGKNGVCLIDLLEFVGVAALVRMVFEGQLSIGLFDIILACVGGDP